MAIRLSIIFACLVAFLRCHADDLHPVTFGARWTNHVPPFLTATISTQPVGGVCPECGAPNHHVRKVQLMATYDEVWLPVIAEGRTNQILLTTTATNQVLVTNIVFQFPTMTMPPTPGRIQRP